MSVDPFSSPDPTAAFIDRAATARREVARRPESIFDQPGANVRARAVLDVSPAAAAKLDLERLEAGGVDEVTITPGDGLRWTLSLQRAEEDMDRLFTRRLHARSRVTPP